jgi:hypothetical protein
MIALCSAQYDYKGINGHHTGKTETVFAENLLSSQRAWMWNTPTSIQSSSLARLKISI